VLAYISKVPLTDFFIFALNFPDAVVFASNIDVLIYARSEEESTAAGLSFDL
jgi:hypothetical protein